MEARLEDLKRLGVDALGRWGEPLSLTCGLIEEPMRLLNLVDTFHSDLALRAMLNAEGIDPADVAAFMREPGRSLAHLKGIAQMWLASGEEGDKIRAEQLLELVVNHELTDRQLATVQRVAAEVGFSPDPQRFFARAGRPLPVPGLVPQMVHIPGGTFEMGTAKGSGSPFEAPYSTQTVSAFEMSATLVTVAQFARWRGDENPERRPDGQLPVTDVTWHEAYLFARWLGCRLPSEAEWEYACRGGTNTTYYSGDGESALDLVGWHKNNSEGRAHAVAEKPANAFGLHDMHGNVWEWCEDCTTPGDPEWLSGETWRVVRGGSYATEARRARSAERSRWPESVKHPFIGFRVVRELG
jgi:formylglycine-generating enzyme required for sulfatase activity